LLQCLKLGGERHESTQALCRYALHVRYSNSSFRKVFTLIKKISPVVASCRKTICIERAGLN